MNSRLSRLLVLLPLFLGALSWVRPEAHAQMVEAARWEVSHSNTEDGVLTLTFSGQPLGHFHVYGLNIPAGGPNATAIEVDEAKGLKSLGKPTTDIKPTKLHDQVFDMELEWFDKPFKVIQKFQITDSAAFSLSGDLVYMACDDKMCTPPTRVSFEIGPKDLKTPLKMANSEVQAGSDSVIRVSGDSVTDPDSLGVQAENVSASGAEAAPVALAAGADIVGPENPLWVPVIDELKAFGDSNYRGKDTSLLSIFILGFLGGFIALLTPCVWPMIPMTVSFFLKRTDDRRKSVRDAIIYGVAIIVIYLALGLLITGIFGASALNSLATSAVFNIIFFLMLVVFAISFFGAFEIVLPESWINGLDRKAEKTGGLLSIFFMSFTLVLVSFSCTGPIIGTLLVDAATKGTIWAPATGMFGFALALALPFSLFAIFPNMLKSMPKSGGWMNSVKVVLAFLELAFALKFLSVADLAYGWGILDREVFVSLWIIIFTLLGLYLLGKLRFEMDAPSDHVSVPRLFMGMISLAFAVYMVPGLWGAPLKSISAFAPPLYTQDFNLYDDEVHAKYMDYNAGMAAAAQSGKPMLLDFSGYGCVNCRKMEAAVWTDPKVKDLIDNEFVLVTVLVDDKTKLPEIIKVQENGRETKLKTVGDKWSYFQRYKFGSNAQPFYVMLDNQGRPLELSYGFDEDIQKYIDWLNSGLKKYRDNK